MLDSTVEILSQYISNPYIIIILISMIPVIESRGSIPYGILVLNLPWYNVVFVKDRNIIETNEFSDLNSRNEVLSDFIENIDPSENVGGYVRKSFILSL